MSDTCKKYNSRSCTGKGNKTTWTVAELKVMLTALGLSTKGLKADLCDRLDQFCKDEGVPKITTQPPPPEITESVKAPSGSKMIIDKSKYEICILEKGLKLWRGITHHEDDGFKWYGLTVDTAALDAWDSDYGNHGIIEYPGYLHEYEVIKDLQLFCVTSNNIKRLLNEPDIPKNIKDIFRFIFIINGDKIMRIPNSRDVTVVIKFLCDNGFDGYYGVDFETMVYPKNIYKYSEIAMCDRDNIVKLKKIVTTTWEDGSQYRNLPIDLYITQQIYQQFKNVFKELPFFRVEHVNNNKKDDLVHWYDVDPPHTRDMWNLYIDKQISYLKASRVGASQEDREELIKDLEQTKV